MQEAEKMMEEYWDDGSPLDHSILLDNTTELCSHINTHERLDMMLPTDSDTTAATYQAFRSYLGAMMEMTERYGKSLSIICIGVDESAPIKFLGKEGASLISRAITRYLRQETRSHDVVGRSTEVDARGYPFFLIACPLLDEEKAGALAVRIVADMLSQALDPERPWMSLSVGVAGMAVDVSDPESLVGRGVASLQRARRNGGKRVWLHSSTAQSIYGLDIENTNNPNQQTKDSEQK